MDQVKIGTLLKALRKEKGVTQEKLAEKTELSSQTINDIEGCRTWVSDKSLIKISEVLYTTPSETNSDSTTIWAAVESLCQNSLRMMRPVLIRDFTCAPFVDCAHLTVRCQYLPMKLLKI